MAIDEHVSGWFRGEFNRACEELGLKCDQLRLHMYEQGFAYLDFVIKDKTIHWTEKQKMTKNTLKMIEYSQGWVDQMEQSA